CSRSGIQLSSVDAIGSHGQTIQHLPYGCEWAGRTIRSTLQIAAPAVIAERTGCCVVSDFRAADIAAGGSGAPLVALVDHELLADPRTSRVVQNIGGIANLTWLPAGAEVEDVLAFDTGPGNLLLDALVRRLTGGRENFDRDGRLALAGRIDQSMVADWAKHPYFDRKPPKSTGPEEFAGHWVDDLVHRATDRGLAGADLLATATAFVAESIAQAYRRYLPADVDEVLLCGGGAANPALVDQLRLRLPAGRVENLSSVGIDPDAKEALSFAILARRTLLGLAGNVPGATGAGRAVVLGSITPGRAAR
ncbi:MAG: anhydro-N-acetylmuramic acid kinase, partial [Planctomycetota bacterium]